VRRYSGQAECEIGDTGAGMTEDYVRNQLFKPFQTTKHSGMGIGTYECQQYLRELGGTIDVSSAPGRGTVMTVRMPLFDAGPAAAADILHSGS
jgi:signal transduction histidine kinase